MSVPFKSILTLQAKGTEITVHGGLAPFNIKSLVSKLDVITPVIVILRETLEIDNVLSY